MNKFEMPKLNHETEKKPKFLTINNLSIEANGGRELLQNFSITINPGDVIGLIGEEGNGKSTLLEFLAGKNLPEGFICQGDISVSGDTKIGYLPQVLPDEWKKIPAEQFFIMDDDPNAEVDYARYNDLANISAILSRFGMNPDEVYEKQMGEFSGGEKVKLQLAKIIFSEPDILLLDEPTNDVDLEFLEWFENFINESQKGIMVISHDETLLENVTTRIVHLEQVKRKSQARHTIANVNYAQYVSQRQSALIQQEAEALRQRREQRKALKKANDITQKIKVEHDATHDAETRRLIGKTQRRQLGNIKQQLDRDLTDRVDVEEAIKIDFPDGAYFPEGKKLADFSLAELTVGQDKNQKILSNDIELHLEGPDHVCITGRNGSGKTTLFKLLKKHLETDLALSVGYFPQDYEEILSDPDKRAVDYLINSQLEVDETYARINMGRMKFTTEEQIAKVKDLSGGQKAKLILLKLMLSGSNVLMLDEPTRNLSPLSNPVIRQAVLDFPGAVISISHDRKYINTCDTVLKLTDSGLQVIEQEV